MSRNNDEAARLRREIEERQRQLEELGGPMSASEAADLARRDPTKFNERVDRMVARGQRFKREDDR